jgi:hypothetical protein
MTDQITSNSSESGEEYGLIYELIHDLFTGHKLAAHVLTSFCTKFKKNIVFNETTSNYNYANYVSSIKY